MGHFDLLCDLVYSGAEMSVSKIAQKISVGFSPNYIFKCFLPISRSSSQMGHFDLLFDLVYSGAEMSVSKITQKVPVTFSPNYILRCFLPIYRASS